MGAAWTARCRSPGPLLTWSLWKAPPVEANNCVGEPPRRRAMLCSSFMPTVVCLWGGWMRSSGALQDPETTLACFRLSTRPANGAGRIHRAWLSLLDLRSYGLGLPYGDQAFALRREVYEEVGGFPAIPLMEDLALARECRRRGRIRHLPLAVRTSGRRFEQRPVRTRLMTIGFPWLFRLGVAPQTLARWYGEVR